MITAPHRAAATSAAAPAPANLQYFVFALFFSFGGITSLNDVVIPKLKALFTLSYYEAMTVQTAFFAAYLIVSVPASFIVKRFGYLRSAALGLLAMMAGCLLFIPAAATATFPAFLIALFVLAAGVTLVQVVANPLISLLGPAKTAHSRLTFAQAFNSVGTTVFPYVGSALILGGLAAADPAALRGAALSAFRTAQAGVITKVYLGLAAALAVVAFVVFTQRNKLADGAAEDINPSGLWAALKRPRLAFGAGCIFLYVGAEVAIGSLIVSYLAQTSTLGLSPLEAGHRVSLYWGGAMIGRFIGAMVLRRVPPGFVLAGCCAVAAGLLALSGGSVGALSGYSLLAIGLFNSIMFPTIFTLACEGLGDLAPDGSGILCVAIVGGAVIPPATGALADAATLRWALALPGLCYLLILGYGVWAELNRRRTRPIG